MSKLALLAEKLGMSVDDVIQAVNEACNHKQARHYRSELVQDINSKLDWNAPYSLWKWKTATEALKSIGVPEPNQSEATILGHTVGRHEKVKRRRSNGVTLLYLPPVIESVPRS